MADEEHFFLGRDDEGWFRTNQEDADYAVIPVKEYNGLINALRIVRDRALQQVDKAKADEHGYTTLRAEYRKYIPGQEYKGWLITKSTPHSINIPLEAAHELILRDLQDFYSFTGIPTLRFCRNGIKEERVLEAGNILKAVSQLTNPSCQDQEYFLEHTEYGHAVYLYLSEYQFSISFELSKIACNYSQGVYEVSYWATTPV